MTDREKLDRLWSWALELEDELHSVFDILDEYSKILEADEAAIKEEEEIENSSSFTYVEG